MFRKHFKKIVSILFKISPYNTMAIPFLLSLPIFSIVTYVLLNAELPEKIQHWEPVLSMGVVVGFVGILLSVYGVGSIIVNALQDPNLEKERHE